MNSKNSKLTDLHTLLLNLTYKAELKRKDRCTALSNLSFNFTWKNTKSHVRTINSKCQLQHGIKNLN